MDPTELRALFEALRRGETSADEAVARLRALPYADLGFARVDHHRAIRQGRTEAVYAPGKSPAHLVGIVTELLGYSPTNSGPIIVSRADTEQVEALRKHHRDVSIHGDPRSAQRATLVWRARSLRDDRPPIVVVTAGTADLPVADECATILHAHGIDVDRINDAGVAGIQRILGDVPLLQRAGAVVVVAGMEGALASVVGGLTGAPVIAVPTSVGYGSGLEGVTALLAMTASCASGITVVGIDNGFGAACAVLRLLDVLASSFRAGDPGAEDGSDAFRASRPVPSTHGPIP